MGRYGRAYTISNVLLAIYVTAFCYYNREKLKLFFNGDLDFSAAKLMDISNTEYPPGPTAEPTSLPSHVSFNKDSPFYSTTKSDK